MKCTQKKNLPESLAASPSTSSAIRSDWGEVMSRSVLGSQVRPGTSFQTSNPASNPAFPKYVCAMTPIVRMPARRRVCGKKTLFLYMPKKYPLRFSSEGSRPANRPPRLVDVYDDTAYAWV